MAGLLTYSLFDAFPSCNYRQWLDFQKVQEITAAGTVQVFHLIPSLFFS
jgi:hypothetical protein